jgi:MFS family permease
LPKPPLKWTAILFAFAANILLVTVTNGLVQTLHWPPEAEVLATLVAPLVAGILTALYVPYRGGMHAFWGGVWQLGVFAGSFCTLGGALTEVITRRTRRTT